jgi:hypothetical protein
MRIDGKGANRTFILRVKDSSGQVKEMSFKLYRDDHGVMRVTPPDEMKAARKR